MQIVRFEDVDTKEPRFGLRTDDGIFDLTDAHPSFSSFLGSVAEGTAETGSGSLKPSGDVRFLAPFEVGNKVLCVALNFLTHADENKVTHPDTPILFLKTYEALINPGDEIHYPSVTGFLDYEAECAVVIGKTAKDVAPEDAYDHVLGYTLLNDVTGRDLVHVKSGERSRNDYFSAKCLDHTTPIGPAIVTKDEFGDPEEALLEGVLNGKTVQSAKLVNLIVSIPDLIAHASGRSTLIPGDIIATGTPGGVGKATGRGLEDGDVFEVRCGPIPALRNPVRSAPAPRG